MQLVNKLHCCLMFFSHIFLITFSADHLILSVIAVWLHIVF